MAKIWRNRIVGETKTFEQCPDRYKGEVLELMRKDVANGDLSAEKFEAITGLTYGDANNDTDNTEATNAYDEMAAAIEEGVNEV